jgi:hypothetical protein
MRLSEALEKSGAMIETVRAWARLTSIFQSWLLRAGQN